MNFERLKELRHSIGATQQNIADILKVQRATYAGWETGKDIMPLRQLNKMANNYKISLDYLTGLSDDNKKIRSKIGDVIDIETVSQNMKNRRKKEQLTQKDVAEILKTTQSDSSAAALSRQRPPFLQSACPALRFAPARQAARR